MQRIGHVETEASCAIVGRIGWRLELRQLPVFVERFSTDAQREIGVKSLLKSLLTPQLLTPHLLTPQLLPIRHIPQSHNRPDDVHTLVRTVQRTVAVVVEFNTAHDSPVVGEAIGSVQAAREINEEARPRQFVVDVVATTVFVFAVADARAEAVVEHPVVVSVNRTGESGIKRGDVAQFRVVIDLFGHSPSLVGRAVHCHVVQVEFQAEIQRRIVVVNGKIVVVLRQGSVVRFDSKRDGFRVFLPFFLPFVHHDDTTGRNAQRITEMS